MKQLYFHFLFFIFFPLLLVQCAQLFPSPENPASANKLSIISAGSNKYGKLLKTASFIINSNPDKANDAKVTFAGNIVFPSYLKTYIKTYPRVSKTYLHFNYRGLLYSYKIVE